MASQSANAFADLRNEVFAMLKNSLAELPDGTASLATADISKSEVLFTLEPTNSEAARIVIHLDESLSGGAKSPLVDFAFGDLGGTWELPLDDAKEFVRAVINGSCEERIGLISTTSTIRISEEKPYWMKSFLQFHPHLFLTNRVRRYRAYV